ncbi:MAG: hypothetical protein P1U56_18020 [Saprospiraceae bacterium]|nr:hypothetical protein [Saprospiraceae bacterium]
MGQFANIDLGIDETVNSIRALDEHNTRFEKMFDAKKKWIEEKRYSSLIIVISAMGFAN